MPAQTESNDGCGAGAADRYSLQQDEMPKSMAKILWDQIRDCVLVLVRFALVRCVPRGQLAAGVDVPVGGGARSVRSTRVDPVRTAKGGFHPLIGNNLMALLQDMSRNGRLTIAGRFFASWWQPDRPRSCCCCQV